QYEPALGGEGRVVVAEVLPGLSHAGIAHTGNRTPRTVGRSPALVGSGAVERVLNDRYELRQHAARGGMADVYHGWDRRLDREVGVKVLRPELSADDDYVDRFREEARTAARLTNPNIVAVFDTGSDQGDAYMVMEWVDGPTLSQVIRAEAPLPVERSCR